MFQLIARAFDRFGRCVREVSFVFETAAEMNELMASCVNHPSHAGPGAIRLVFDVALPDPMLCN
jgi:hypothetical protein